MTSVSPLLSRVSRRTWPLISLALMACGNSSVPAPEPNACLNFPRAVTIEPGDRASDWSDVAIDARGRVWLAGYANGTVGATNIEPSGNSRAVVRQLAPNGAVLFDSGSALDTPGTDVAEALAFSENGDVIAVGRTTGALAGTNAGQFDTFVTWNDAAEFSNWRTVQFGTERPQHPRRAAVDALGDLVIAGYDDTFVPSNFVVAWEDPFAAKLGRERGGENGWSPHWTHAFSTASPDLVDGLAVTTDGSTFVSGSSALGETRGMFVRKLDASGRAAWTARYSQSGADHIAAVRVLSDGTLLIAGSVFGSFRGEAAFGRQDAFVARIHPDDGRVLGAWQFGSSGAEWSTDLAIGPDGAWYLLLETDGALANRPAAGGSDLALLKISANGALLAAAQWGTEADELARRVAVDACGTALAVGATANGARRDAVTWQWKP